MQLIHQNIRWRDLVEIYKTAKFDRSSNNLSGDIVLNEQCPKKRKKKKNEKNKNKRYAFAWRSN